MISKSNDSLAGEEQVLIDNTSLSDEYILQKIVKMSKKPKEESCTGDRVFIFPTLQMNVINYREEEDFFLKFLKYLSTNSNSSLKLATGYLNLQSELVSLLKQNPTLQADILTSSPRANGFYKAGLFKKYIPGMYRANEYALLR